MVKYFGSQKVSTCAIFHTHDHVSFAYACIAVFNGFIPKAYCIVGTFSKSCKLSLNSKKQHFFKNIDNQSRYQLIKVPFSQTCIAVSFPTKMTQNCSKQ